MGGERGRGALMKNLTLAHGGTRGAKILKNVLT